jgi:serine protease inhibitor
MRTLLACLALSLCTLMIACTARQAPDKPLPPANPQVKKLAAANNEFGLTLLRELHEEGENFAISPTSIAMALQLTATGARGGTLDEMLEVMRTGDIDLPASNRAFLDNMKQDRGVTLSLANSVWVDPGRMTLVPAFVEAAGLSFDAAAREENFGDPATVDKINGWVAERTNDRITDLLDEIGGAVGAYLINAVYFKGNWTVQFKKSLTEPREFQLATGESVQVPMMYRRGDFDALYDDGTMVVRLPFGANKQASMMFVLPAEDSSVGDLLGNLTPETVGRWQEGVSKRTREGLYLPRFEMRYKKDLGEVLQARGMRQAFDADAADFSGMGGGVGGDRVYISRVLHEVFVLVNEEGAEAAAATAVEMEVLSMPQETWFNRPFMFLIVDDVTGSVLFAGAVYDPRE